MFEIYSLLIKCLFCISLLITVNANTFLWNSNHDTPQWQRTSLQNTAVCVDIPSNLTLCQGIGYTKMRLPNLLNHDSLREVSQQATSWVPLSQLNCHPDTQLFLCSLFSPVCLDHPIPPCRSLCQSVQASCEHVMLNYGYPWPKLVQCDQFPIDNDMCIQAQHSSSGLSPSQSLGDKNINSANNENNKNRKGNHKKNSGKKQRRFHAIDNSDFPAKKETVFQPEPGHQRSSQLDSETKIRQEPQVDQVIDSNGQTAQQPNQKWNKDQRQLYNDIIEKFCHSEWIIKARLHTPNSQKSEVKVRNYRLIQGSIQQKQTPLVLSVNNSIIDLIKNQANQQTEGPQQLAARRRYFIIGRNNGKENVITFIIQWPHKSAQLRKAIKAITNQNYNCSDSEKTINKDNNKSVDKPKNRRDRKEQKKLRTNPIN